MNIEEKAKQYADGIIENCQLDSPWNCEEIHWQLRDAYTQAVTDLSAESEKLREALREIVLYTDDMQNAKTDFDYNMSSAERKAAIIRAKQLLK